MFISTHEKVAIKSSRKGVNNFTLGMGAKSII